MSVQISEHEQALDQLAEIDKSLQTSEQTQLAGRRLNDHSCWKTLGIINETTKRDGTDESAQDSWSKGIWPRSTTS
jgi:hypothetical protein